MTRGSRPPPLAAVRGALAVLARHWRYARGQPRKLAWIARRISQAVRSGELRGVLARHAQEAALERDYEAWVTHHEPSPGDLDTFSVAWRRWPHQPVISVVFPVFDPPIEYLLEAIDSVTRQVYPRWELLIVDDGSTRPEVADLLRTVARNDQRIRVYRHAANTGVVGATNTAIAQATGAYACFLDHDDLLASLALYRVAEAVNDRRDVQFLYSDEDRIDASGTRGRPLFKSGWNPELMQTINAALHLSVIEIALLRQLGGMRPGLDGVQDWDLALRVSESVDRSRIRHLPWILYHWRAHPGSTAAVSYEKRLAEAQQRLVSASLDRRSPKATAAWTFGGWRLRFPMPPANAISVVIVVSTERFLRRCLDRLGAVAHGRFGEVLLAGPADVVDVLAPAGGMDATWRAIHVTGNGYASLCNKAVSAARGQVVLLIADAVELHGSDAFEDLVSHAARPEVGIVAATIRSLDGTICSASVVLGVNGVADLAHVGEPPGYRGMNGQAGYVQEVGAVLTDCVAFRRDVYLAVGGMDASTGASSAGVDLSLRLRAHGKRVLWSPHAVAYRRDSRTAAQARTTAARWRSDLREFATMWPGEALSDPYYNPNLARTGVPFMLDARAKPDDLTPHG
ncbi:MAG: glycosyltransferase [Casimicrobiaceae bacterium]